MPMLIKYDACHVLEIKLGLLRSATSEERREKLVV
jgi:hypothetical protein